MNFEIPNCTREEWMATIKPYQRDIITAMLASNSNDTEKTVAAYLSANGPENTKPFGGVVVDGSSKTFFDRFKDEFDKFVCGHNDYKQYYPKLETGTSNIQIMLVSSISAAIGSALGINASFLAPAVVLFLSVVGNMTRNAYCANKCSCVLPQKKSGGENAGIA